MLTIGDNVRVSFDLAFVTHDGGTHVLRGKYPNASIYGKIPVDDNVFIGAHSIILPGVTIGKNMIVAAGSVVNRNVEGNNCVWVPARVIGNV